MNKAIEIGEKLGVMREQSSCDYSYLVRVKHTLENSDGHFRDIAYIQKLIDELMEQ